MAPYNSDAPRIGTADTLIPYRRVDSRQCPRCGAVAGRCDHMKSDADIVWLSKSQDRKPPSFTAWSAEQRDTMRRLYLAGSTFDEIAEVFNTTRSAVSGLMHRMGVRRV